ncbi:hypothetical protein JL720_16810 [Aureococcus anophagefferens]|nr:hypothetical protein JL720_16810 [Aureococcus anophagefferens]
MAPQDIVKAQRDRYLYVLSLLVGQKAEAELLEKKTMTGVLHTATPFSDMPHRMVLKGAAEKARSRPRPAQGGKWDQFEANERLFGASADYGEACTAASAIPAFTPAQKAEAARIAAEIENDDQPVPYAQPGLPYGFTPPPQFMAPPARRYGGRRVPGALRRPVPGGPPRGNRGGGGGGEGKAAEGGRGGGLRRQRSGQAPSRASRAQRLHNRARGP